MKRLFLAGVLVLVLVAPAWADLDAGVEAYQRGDYAAALKEWRPLAELGAADAQFYLGLIRALSQRGAGRAGPLRNCR